MTDTKHTPGPWGFTGEPHGYAVWQTARECQAKPQRVATVTGRHPVEEEEANARLIAAAPDMLEALQACVLGLEEFYSPGEMSGHPAVRAARAAIRKATRGDDA